MGGVPVLHCRHAMVFQELATAEKEIGGYMIFGYLFCLIASAAIGGLTLLLSMCTSFPLWLQLIIWGAAAPIYLLTGIIYGGGLSCGARQIFGKDTTESKDA